MSAQPVSLSLVENATGVGHYKGVMLCNRPFAGSVAINKAPAVTPNTFNCGVVSTNIGQNVPISQKEKMVKRPKKDSVLVKHKKWLADLQKTKERLEEEYLDEARRKEEEKLRFQEHEKKMRELSRSIMRDDKEHPETTSSSAALSAVADAKRSSSISFASSADEKGAGAKGEEFKAQTKGVGKKPAWALSEDKAAHYSEQKQEAEDDALLDFALGLNYDKIVGDVEVQTMIERLRKRILELEKESEREEQRELDAETRAAQREMLQLMGETQASLQAPIATSAEEEARRKTSQALSTAKALLGEDTEMQNVHSTKSVVALLVQAKEKIGHVRDSVKALGPPAEPRVVNEPKIVVHEPSEGLRLEQKHSVANLPYMHRNPSV